MAAPSCGELGATEPVRCGFTSHSRRNSVESAIAAIIFLAMSFPDSMRSLIHLFDHAPQKFHAGAVSFF
jgi:hypothetical protein